MHTKIIELDTQREVAGAADAAQAEQIVACLNEQAGFEKYRCDGGSLTYFALKSLNGFSFNCVSSKENAFKQRVARAYNNWRGLQPRLSDPTMDAFLEQYAVVTVTITPCEVKL